MVWRIWWLIYKIYLSLEDGISSSSRYFAIVLLDKTTSKLSLRTNLRFSSLRGLDLSSFLIIWLNKICRSPPVTSLPSLCLFILRSNNAINGTTLSGSWIYLFLTILDTVDVLNSSLFAISLFDMALSVSYTHLTLPTKA